MLAPMLQKAINRYLILEYAQEAGVRVSGKELEACIREIKKDYTEAGFREALLHGYIDFQEWKDTLKDQLLEKNVH